MKQILAEIAFLLFLSDVLSISDLFHHSNDLALDHEFVLPHSSAVVCSKGKRNGEQKKERETNDCSPNLAPQKTVTCRRIHEEPTKEFGNLSTACWLWVYWILCCLWDVFWISVRHSRWNKKMKKKQRECYRYQDPELRQAVTGQ